MEVQKSLSHIKMQSHSDELDGYPSVQSGLPLEYVGERNCVTYRGEPLRVHLESLVFKGK